MASPWRLTREYVADEFSPWDTAEGAWRWKDWRGDKVTLCWGQSNKGSCTRTLMNGLSSWTPLIPCNQQPSFSQTLIISPPLAVENSFKAESITLLSPHRIIPTTTYRFTEPCPRVIEINFPIFGTTELIGFIFRSQGLQIHAELGY